jgi:hypothetical protein
MIAQAKSIYHDMKSLPTVPRIVIAVALAACAAQALSIVGLVIVVGATLIG